MFWLKWAKKSVFFSKKSPVQQSNGASQTWKEWFYTKASDRIFSSFTTRKGSLTWPHRTDRTRRSQRWRKQVRQKPRPKPGRWGPFWLKSVLPTGEVRYNSGPGGCHVVCWGWSKNAYNLPVFPPKNLEWSARSGELFFWGRQFGRTRIELNKMKWLTVLPKNVSISMSLSHLYWIYVDICWYILIHLCCFFGVHFFKHL